MTNLLQVESGEFCPHCNSEQRRKVLRSRTTFTNNGPIRWRRCTCPECGSDWRTVELLLPTYLYHEFSREE